MTGRFRIYVQQINRITVGMANTSTMLIFAAAQMHRLLIIMFVAIFVIVQTALPRALVRATSLSSAMMELFFLQHHYAAAQMILF
jgi:hypothetical protein